MGNKDKKRNNQFKENSNHGAHRNGRLSQIKNHHATGGEPNEYLNRKADEEEHGPNTIN